MGCGPTIYCSMVPPQSQAAIMFAFETNIISLYKELTTVFNRDQEFNVQAVE